MMKVDNYEENKTEDRVGTKSQKLLEFLDCGLAMVAFILTPVNNVDALHLNLSYYPLG